MSRLAAVLLAIGVTVFATITTLVGVASGAPAEFLVADAVTGMTFVVAGLIAAWLRPASPAGPLLLVSGGLWFVGSYAPTGQPIVTHLGFAFEAYYDLTLAVLLLLLSAPGQGLRPRPLVLALAIAMGARSLGRLLLQDPVVFFDCAECPANPFALLPDRGLFEAVDVVTNLAMGVLFVLVGVVAARRLLEAGPTARRARRPVLIAGALAMAGAAYDAFDYAWSNATGTSLVVLGEPADSLFHWLVFVLRVLVPIGFLVGVLRQRAMVGPLAPLAARIGRTGGSGGIGEAVRTALGDPSLSLFRAVDGGAWASETGVVVPTVPADDHQVVTPVGSTGAPVAALSHDPALREHPELLDGVVTILRLALENERLDAELREQLDEVKASRSRIVAATEEERRRLERDLHDGAQQRLVAASLALGDARAVADASVVPTALTHSLDTLADELKQAIRELRELARGIHPAILASEGLGPAVAGLARRAAIPIEVRVELAGRLPDVVESTAYFTIAEALTNTQRYAQASHALVSVVAVDQGLEIRVSDDGIGGADPRRGSGLRGLADRLTAIGGDLRVDSPAGHGTAVLATIPIP